MVDELSSHIHIKGELYPQIFQTQGWRQKKKKKSDFTEPPLEPDKPLYEILSHMQ